MKILRSFLVFCTIALVGLGIFHDRILGKVLKSPMEKALAGAFDMPVSVNGLRVRLWPGHVTIDELAIHNPKGYQRTDHISAKGIDLSLDMGALKEKFVRIKKAHIRELTFAIESYMAPEGSRTNVMHWYYFMGLDADDPPIPEAEKTNPLTLEQAVEKSAAAGYWRVVIQHLELENGTFVFDDRRVNPPTQLIFRNLKGYWDGFDYVKFYRMHTYTEDIELAGTFGKDPPARFHGKGKCQFADGDNFDFRIEITGGSLTEYKFLLEGLPGEVRGGTFDLRSKMYSLHSDLESDHVLILRDLKLATPKATQKLFKYPVGGVLWLLADQKSIELNVRVNGYIGDPKFWFFSAFTQALNKALLTKAGMTLKGLHQGTLKIATETPDHLKNGIGMIGDVLAGPFDKKAGEKKT